MSDNTEDLITLSPCAPKVTLHSPTPSPFRSTDALDDNPGASPRSISNAKLHLDTNSGLKNSSHNQEKMSYADKQVPKSQYGNHVVISPLPRYIAKRDILCRVRGGKVLSCILSNLNGSLVAIVIFEQRACAQHYVDFCAEPFNKDLWTFTSDPGSIPFSYMTATVKIYNEAPGLGVTWRHEDIPGIPKTYPSSTTRCLCLTVCPADGVVGIWAQLGLARSEHLRDQLDDMWLDRPEWNVAVGNNCGTLHIWYAHIKSAMEAQRRCPSLEYEADPCSTMPHEAFSLGPDKANDGSDNSAGMVYIDHHSYPFVSLLDLHKDSVLVDVSRGVLDPYEAFWGIRAPQPVEEDAGPMNLTERLMHVLRTHSNGKRDGTCHGTQTRALHLPPGFANHSSGGPVKPLTNGYEPSPASGMDSRPTNYHTHTMGQHGLVATGMKYGRIEPHHESHIHNDPPSTNLNHAQTQPSNEGLTSQDTPAMSMSHSVEDPRSNFTNHVDPPRPGRLDFKMPQPRPGYTHQFPPPLGGGPPVVEYPSAVAEAMDQKPAGQGSLARRINRMVHQREVLHSDAQGDANIRAHATSTATCASTSSSLPSLVTAPSSGSDPNNSDSSRSSNESPTTQPGPNYSRENWASGRGPEDVFWTVSLEEFRAMDDDQWKAFGTSFYIPPPGYNTAKRHVIPLE
ncbi:hypothetical protein VMCG_07811 [Cytospora schulzeri]|uniref:Uncharacterized protein n=1 Tax=Cytospora schulzeri TaxID=448051 RepID=A0A423VZX7_9PEZI|nr:hypothetical protein VMCG_07811 [Valsa malicola]